MTAAPPPAAPRGSAASVSTSGFAVAALVLGILGVCTACVGVGAIAGLIALVLGIVALVQIGKPEKPERGKGLAITGIVLGGLSLVIVPLAIAVLLPALSAARQAAQQASATSQSRMVSLSLFSYAIDNEGEFSDNEAGWIDLGTMMQHAQLDPQVTQSPVDSDPGLPADFFTRSPDEQATWVRQNSDLVSIPGVGPRGQSDEVLVFGRPDRFGGHGVPVIFYDGHVEWRSEDELPQLDQQLQQQTGMPLDEIIDAYDDWAASTSP